jgi:hypothetical protein
MKNMVARFALNLDKKQIEHSIFHSIFDTYLILIKKLVNAVS